LRRERRLEDEFCDYWEKSELLSDGEGERGIKIVIWGWWWVERLWEGDSFEFDSTNYTEILFMVGSGLIAEWKLSFNALRRMKRFFIFFVIWNIGKDLPE